VRDGQLRALTDIRVVFIDDGGVLNDNNARAPQWRRLLGEYFVPRLGGTPQAWASANVSAFQRSWERFMARIASAGESGGVDNWTREERGRWLVDMCEQVGVVTPDDVASVGVDASIWVGERVQAAMPGAVEAVRTFKRKGLVIHTASGGMSWELDPYLRSMGIRQHFDRLYGPDLVDRYKNGPHYHSAILADSGTDPGHAAIVDDWAESRAWAGSLGMRSFRTLAEAVMALA
jgi:phosphoglycolate phosphatase-like HAD superfamily hydrolase